MLPDLVLAHRLDAVTVIGTAMLQKLTSGRGLRPIATDLDVPHTTVRAWWQRFRLRWPMLLATCTHLAVALDGTPVDVRSVGERAALEVLSLAWQRAKARFGERIGGGSVWSFWSMVSGGLGLGTHTTSPWAAFGGTDWMRPSPMGGPAP